MDPCTFADRTGFEDCPRCSAPIPLPLGNFCSHCRFPLRLDSEKRAARIQFRRALRFW